MTTAAVLTTVAILLGCFASSHAVRVPIVKLGDNPLETLAQEIIACQCISEKIIGTGNADSLELALHTRNLTLSFVHTSVTNDNSLQVDANLDIWSHRVYMTAFLTYDNSQLNLQLGFNTTFNLTTLYELILPGDKVPSFMWDISKFASEASVELSTAPLNGRPAGVSVEAGITLTPGSYLFEIATVLGEIDNNGQIAGSLFFPFPASSKKHGMRGGSFTLLDFSFHIDGTWHLGKNIVANGLNFTIDIGNPTTVSVGSVLSINMFRSTTQWNGQTSFTYGTSIAAFTFTCTLAQQWANTFGMKWINVETATVTLTISDQMQPNSIQISGTTQLGFSKTTAQFTGSITDYIDILFVLEDIPVASLAQIVSTTTNSNPDVINGLSATSTATIALSTFSGQYQEGLTLSADIVCSSGTMLGVQKQVTNQPLNWVLTLYIPIFSESPEDIQFTMTETNPIQMTSNTQITTLTFQVSVNYELSINIAADWAMVFSGNGGQTVTFTTTANYVTGQNLQFQGQLTSPWNDPFGGKWLTIDSASATIVIGEAVAHSLDISAEVTVSFNSKSSAQTTAELQTGSSFDDVTFSLTIQEDWTVSEIGSGVAGISSPMLGGVVTNEATFEFIICNYQGGMAQEGLTLITNGQITKPITGLFSMIAPGQTGQVTWQVNLFIPVFGNPAQWVLDLNFSDEIQINAHWWFESLHLYINNQANTAQVSSVLRADLHNNPNIMFTVGGNVESDGELILYGEEQGTWTDVFGITGLTITDAYTQLGLDSTMCSIDGCISQVGIGFTTQVGNKTIIYAGNAAAPNFGACFLMGSISDSDGVVLTMRDIAKQWNVMVPSYQININSIPPNWGLESALLSLASDAGTFGQYTYEEGLHFMGTLLILEQTYTVDIDCGLSGLAPSCDFNWNVQVDFDSFLEMLKKEVFGDETTKWSVFTLKSVSLGDWKTSNLAQLVDPLWNIDIEVWGNDYNLTFRTPTETLAGSFQDFYNQYLKQLFS